jgi:hypothetical protein
MMERELSALLEVPFSFKRRPPAIPGDLRPIWRISALVLILEKCRGQRASLRQLHVMNWAIRTGQNRRTFLKAVEGHHDLEHPIVRFEPSLNRAIDFAIGEGLAERSGDRILLSDKGKQFATALNRAEDLLVSEKAFLRQIEGKITQQVIDRVLQWNEVR